MGKAEELAAAVEALGKRKRRNYPSELRQQIADHVREQRSAGVPLKTISRTLGVGPTLLRRWEVERVGAFRRVELTGALKQDDGWVLQAPCGVVVEGLTLEALIVILRGLA